MAPVARSQPADYPLAPRDLVMLDQIQQRAVRFFVEHSDPHTGLTRDRAPTDGSPSDAPASMAATGFALTAWCIADARGWVSREQASQHVRTTLEFALNHVDQVHGWFYHFVDIRTGRRDDASEVSTIDTALFLQGALFAREYLKETAVSRLVNAIYRRIDWRWALDGGATLSMGWRPESGFIPHRWDSYCELMGMYLLGIGASNHPLPPASWDAWRRGPRVTFDGRSFIQCAPLFTHQYSHAYFDFRGLRDDYADYWQNSVDATLAQRDWSAAQKTRFPHWSRDMWGLTASDGPRGYMAWGTPGPAKDESDGTLVPCAPGGSLPFAPRECLTSLRRMRTVGGSSVWGRYGFADAFNPETGWVSPDVIGIDVGITLVMAENLRSGMIWNAFMQAPEVRRAMRLAGFEPDSGAANRPATTLAATHPAEVRSNVAPLDRRPS
ncbi:MAG TPA: glucoamylase family protein [Opitutaceae bacterium]|nr:glucoamylase family protein [Opitutaceae bacterium]